MIKENLTWTEKLLVLDLVLTTALLIYSFFIEYTNGIIGFGFMALISVEVLKI